MEHFGLRKHWAAIKIGGEWHIYEHPTIGELQSLRRKGAVILHLIVERHGNQINRTWVSDSGIPVTVSTLFL